MTNRIVVFGDSYASEWDSYSYTTWIQQLSEDHEIINNAMRGASNSFIVDTLYNYLETDQRVTDTLLYFSTHPMRNPFTDMLPNVSWSANLLPFIKGEVPSNNDSFNFYTLHSDFYAKWYTYTSEKSMRIQTMNTAALLATLPQQSIFLYNFGKFNPPVGDTTHLSNSNSTFIERDINSEFDDPEYISYPNHMSEKNHKLFYNFIKKVLDK